MKWPLFIILYFSVDKAKVAVSFHQKYVTFFWRVRVYITVLLLHGSFLQNIFYNIKTNKQNKQNPNNICALHYIQKVQTPHAVHVFEANCGTRKTLREPCNLTTLPLINDSSCF